MLKKNNIKELESEIETITANLAFMEEQNKKFLITEEQSQKFLGFTFDSFPVSSLMDSLQIERNLPRNRFTLKEFKFKFMLKKAYNKKKIELEKKKSELAAAKIELLLSDIADILSGEKKSFPKRKKSKKIILDSKAKDLEKITVPTGFVGIKPVFLC